MCVFSSLSSSFVLWTLQCKVYTSDSVFSKINRHKEKPDYNTTTTKHGKCVQAQFFLLLAHLRSAVAFRSLFIITQCRNVKMISSNWLMSNETLDKSNKILANKQTIMLTNECERKKSFAAKHWIVFYASLSDVTGVALTHIIIIKSSETKWHLYRCCCRYCFVRFDSCPLLTAVMAVQSMLNKLNCNALRIWISTIWIQIERPRALAQQNAEEQFWNFGAVQGRAQSVILNGYFRHCKWKWKLFPLPVISSDSWSSLYRKKKKWKMKKKTATTNI